jgi:UDPglucose 6-dehydrogenase
MKIAVIGTGYVGLVSGACLAAKGNDVTCVDSNPAIVEKLNHGHPHIFENGLGELLGEILSAGRFRATTDMQTTMQTHDVFIVAVGTPSEEGRIDLAQIEAVARTIGAHIRDTDRYISVIVKSTVIPGTTDTFVRQVIERESGKSFGSFGLGMNPEFLREGEAVTDFMHPDRIVIGAEDEITSKRLFDIYKGWDCDKLAVNTRTAEMIKYANNTVLASIISLNNELANMATLMGGIDYMDVVKGVSLDRRWSVFGGGGERHHPAIIEYMRPGVGFGGSCFPKDVQAIRTQGMNLGLPMTMTNALLSVNDEQVQRIMEILESRIGGLSGRKTLLLGLAFKPGTDDIRDSSALRILKHLGRSAAPTTFHDPIVEHQSRYEREGAICTDNWTSVVDEAELIIIGTNWPEYKELLKMDSEGRLKGKTVFDSKRLFRKGDFSEAAYFTVG